MADRSPPYPVVTPINPCAPQVLPVTPEIITAHQQMRTSAGVHPLKDRVSDQEEPAFDFDVAEVEAAICSNRLPAQEGAWPTAYAERQWHLSFENNVLSQGEGSNLDLIWVATMPPSRLAMPVLVIEYQNGLSLLDGSHRLARAFMDGKENHPGLIIQRADALPFRKPRATAELRVGRSE